MRALRFVVNERIVRQPRADVEAAAPVCVAFHTDMEEAIAREKQLMRWHRTWKNRAYRERQSEPAGYPLGDARAIIDMTLIAPGKAVLMRTRAGIHRETRAKQMLSAGR